MEVCRCLCLWKIKWKENVENIFVEKPRKWEFFYTLSLLSCVCSLHVKLSNPYDWKFIAEVLLFENIIVNKFPSNSRNLVLQGQTTFSLRTVSTSEEDSFGYNYFVYVHLEYISLTALLLLHINCNIPDESNF